MRVLFAVIVMLFCLVAQVGASGRYLTWVDEQGRVHNTFVDTRYSEQQRQAARRIALSDQVRMQSASAGQWPGQQHSGESKRRYFTWVDANGNLQNGFYAGTQVGGGNEVVLAGGEHTSDYIDSDALEGRGYSRTDQDGQYFTWVDEQGRMRNSRLPSAAVGTAPAAIDPDRFTEGRQVTFDTPGLALPGLDGQPTAAMQALLAGSQARDAGRYQELTEHCCGQLPDEAFTALSADEPRYEALNSFSPRFDFPMGRSYYAALKLPHSRHTYGLRVRSFANKQMVYPSLLFLDESRRPTRLVSDAVYQLHAETWYRYAFIEGVVPVRAAAGERYVLLLTTDADRTQQTLDNKPFKRPLQALSVNEAGMQTHAHGDEGEFELAIVR